MKSASRPFRRSRHLEWAIFVAILLAGCALRLTALGAHPYGLYQDEAVNGLDALRVLDGGLALYFPANNGREPFFITLMALTIALFGRTTLGVRAAAALLGILTIPATYALGRAWANRRVGLLAAGILAVMLWHVHLSRVGFRAVALPLFTTLALAAGAYALEHRSRWAAVGAGALYGLSFYTYLAARFTPLALALMALYGIIWRRAWLRERWQELLLAAAAAAVAAAPLGVFMLLHPELVMGRGAQVAIWNPAIHGGDLPSALWRSVWQALGMFFWRGDTIWRHNVPGRPVFDPLMGLAFLGGLWLALRRWREQPAGPLTLLWTLVLLLPTVLAEDSPHFLRAVGVLPVVTLLPALALDRVANLVETRLLSSHHPHIAEGEFHPSPLVGEGKAAGGRRPSAAGMGGIFVILLALILGISAALTVRNYFGCRSERALQITGFDYVGCYADDPIRGYFFQSAATDLAYDVNAAEGTVILARRLWETFPSVQFLAGGRESLRLYAEGVALDPVPAPMTLFVWPHVSLEPTLHALPRDSAISVTPGPETRGDLEPEPYVLYVRYRVTVVPDLPPALAGYDNGILLRRVVMEPDGGGWRFHLWWEAEREQVEPVQVFAHLVDAETGVILAQHDAPPGTAYFPSLSWRAGDVIIEEFTLTSTTLGDGPDDVRLQIGLYRLADGTRLTPRWANAPVVENALELTLSE
jgi:4-amino-4-deoxy-L-arabinose transferase-like glycosyltransferase